MSLVSKRVSLLVSVVYLSTGLANTGFRPMPSNRPSTSAGATGFASKMDQQRVMQIRTGLDNLNSIKPLKSGTSDALLAAFQISEGARKSMEGVLFQAAIAKDPITMESLALKLDILAALSEENLDLVTAERAGNNRKDLALYLIYSLVNNFNVHKLANPNSQRNALQILEEVYNQLTIEPGNYEVILENALKGFNADTSMSLSMESMYMALADRKSDGLTEEFMSYDDRKMITIGEGDGKLEVVMSQQEADIIVAEAQQQLTDLIRLTYTSKDVRADANRMLRPEKKLTAESYIKDSHLLDRNASATESATKVHNLSAKNYDDIIKEFRKYGSIIDGNKAVGATQRFIQDKIPFVGNYLAKVNDKSLQKKTIGEKIALLRKALSDGAKQIENDNKALNRTRMEIADYSNALVKEIARFQIMSELLNEHIKSVIQREGEDSPMVRTLKGAIGVPIETERDAALSVNGTLIRAQAQIDGLITVGIGAVNLSRVVDQEIFPMLKLSEGLMGVAALQQSQMAKINAIKQLKAERDKALVDQMEKVYKNAADLLGASFEDPEKRAALDQRLATAREKFEKDRAAAFDKKRALNAKHTAAQNKAQRSLGDGGLNTRVNEILNEGK